ncbi:MAG: hypothetical protein IJ217_03540 [Clostridia bacterium]|nr:hypothetical protein [Clostridia bacterium]
MKKLICVTMLILFAMPSFLFAGERVSLGFLYGASDSVNLVRRTNGSINEVAPTYFDLNKKGNLVISSAYDEKFVAEMKNDGIKITPFLSNHWSRTLGRAALKNRENLTDQIVQAIEKYDLDGINVDIENLTASDRDDFTEFVRLLREKLPAEKQLTVSVAPNPYAIDSSWQASYDYRALGELVDYLFVMTYDEHSSGGAAGPVASGDFVELSIQYALQHVDKSKIVIGIPLYGRFWRDGDDVGGEAIVIGDVPRVVSRFKGKTMYDKKAQTPNAKFYVPEGSSVKVNGNVLAEGNYTVWYENEQSIKYKLELVNKYNLRGAGVWALGQEKVDVWEYYKEALNEAFEEEEVVNIHELFATFQGVPMELEIESEREEIKFEWKKFELEHKSNILLEVIPKKKENLKLRDRKEDVAEEKKPHSKYSVALHQNKLSYRPIGAA